MHHAPDEKVSQTVNPIAAAYGDYLSLNLFQLLDYQLNILFCYSDLKNLVIFFLCQGQILWGAARN